MTADSFLDYLEHPSHLYQISYQELKSLVVQYPYCQNLRYLLLKKSQLENHRDLNRNLSLAATYAADRSRLFQLSHQAIETEEALEFLDLETLANQAEKETVLAENVSFDFALEEAQTGDTNLALQEVTAPSFEEKIIEDDEDTVVFELPLLDSFSAFDTLAESQEAEIHQEATQETTISMSYPNSFEANTWLNEQTNTETISELDEIDAEIAAAMERLAAQQNVETIDSPTAVDKLPEEDVPDEVTVTKANADNIPARPEPKVSFSSWLSQFKAPARRGEGKGYDVLLTPLDLESPIEKRKKKKKKKSKKEKGKNALDQMLATKQKAIKKRKKKKKKKNRIVAKAVMSLVESEDLVSETLASILVEQERYKKAIKMYKRLSLKFPEKNAYFAGKIEKIKKLM